MAKFNCKPESGSGYIEKNKELLNDVNRLETENARLTTIVEGLPDVDIIKNTINLNIIIDDTRLDDPRLDSDSVLKTAEALAARLHNPTISKTETVCNPPEPVEPDPECFGEHPIDDTCPNCGREYDQIDIDHQICSRCGYNNNPPDGAGQEKGGG